MAIIPKIDETVRLLKLDGRSAQRYAAKDNIEAWVHKYLCSGFGGQTNQPFSEALKRGQR